MLPRSDCYRCWGGGGGLRGAIASAPAIDESEAETLTRQETLSPEEQLSLEKFYLEKFYQSKIAAADVLWDNSGRRRSQIRRLEAVLDPEKAEAITAASIKNSPTAPQDWKVIKLQQEILERSGAAALIRDIWAGQVVQLEGDRILAIAKFFKRHSKDVAIAFNFRNIGKVSDNQAAFLALDWVGLQRNRIRQRLPGGEIGSNYEIDLENLELFRAIAARRSADPPPELDLKDEGGGTGELLDSAGIQASLGLSGLPSDLAAELISLYQAAPGRETIEAIASIVTEIKAKTA